jgi:hypothetical protein
MFLLFKFSIKEILIHLSYCLQTAFVCEFQQIPIVQNGVFLKVPYISWV